MTTIIAPASTTTYTNRSVYDDCIDDGCGLIGIFIVDVFLSNYSSESGSANDDESQQYHISNETKSRTQLDTIVTATTYTVTSNGDGNDCLLSTGHVARTINESTIMHITVNHGKC